MAAHRIPAPRVSVPRIKLPSVTLVRKKSSSCILPQASLPTQTSKMACRLAISSMSLGRCFAGHCLDHKLDMARKYGYEGIELFYEDLDDIACRLPGGDTPLNQLQAARVIGDMCRVRGLTVICLQPFMHYDGLVNREEHARRLARLRLWMDMAHILDTDIIQIPANFLPPAEVSAELDLIVSDLVEVAEMGLEEEPVIRFAYESLSWSTRVDTWEACWDVVRRVDRPNFGMCLDTFNIAGRIYADPASPSGKLPGCDRAVRESVGRLVAEVDVRKVFYVQVVDAERLAEPLIEGHPLYQPHQSPRMSWSRNCRLFYGEHGRGAYLPVQQIAAAFFKGLGFRGWVSLELFNRRMSESDPDIPEELARRGSRAWTKLVKDMSLVGMPTSL